MKDLIMKKNYIKPTTSMVVLHSQSSLLTLSAHTSTDPYGGEAGAKEIEVKNPNLWDNSNEMWAMEDEEDK